MSLELVKAMKLTDERSGYVICFAGRRLAYWAGNSQVATASWYMGRGRPDDFPPELDLWIWGGISLATERIMWKEEFYRYLNWIPLLLSICLGVPLYGPRFGMLAFASVILLTVCLFVGVYFWRVYQIQKAVQDVLAPKLNPLGFAIECHQRPWFSYYTIHRSYTSIVPQVVLEDKEQEDDTTTNTQEPINSTSTSLFPTTDEEDGSVKLPAIMSVPWDWQGYTRVLPGTQFQKMQAFLVDVWTWGALMEMTRGRTYSAETKSPPLIHMRRLRRMRSLGTVSFNLFVGLTLVYLYFTPVVEWAPWACLSLQFSLFGLAMICFWQTGFGKPLLLAEPLIGIVKATLEELGPAIEQKTGITMELDEMANRFGMCGWTYEQYCIKMYPPPPPAAPIMATLATTITTTETSESVSELDYDENDDDLDGII